MNIEPENQVDACSKEEFLERFNVHLEPFQRQLVEALETDFEKHLSSHKKAE